MACVVTDCCRRSTGDILAVGHRDSAIELLDVKGDYGRLAVLNGHTSRVVSVDWSADGAHLQSASRAGELLYWAVGERGARHSSGLALKDPSQLSSGKPHDPISDSSCVVVVGKSLGCVALMVA